MSQAEGFMGAGGQRIHINEGVNLRSTDLKILVVGAGSCGKAVSSLIKKIYGFNIYYYDIDPLRSVENAYRSSGLDGYDAYHICVPEEEVASVVSRIPAGSEIIIHSTMPPGSTRSLGKNHIVYIPLFFREKHIEEDIDKPGRIVIGTSDGACPRGWAGNLSLKWSQRSGANIYCLSYEEAEIVKLGTNALRALAISFYNEVYEILYRYGGDYGKVFEILSPSLILDRFEGGMWGRKHELAGTPFGGKCLPKDTMHLARASPMANSIFMAILRFNEELAMKQGSRGHDRQSPGSTEGSCEK